MRLSALVLFLYSNKKGAPRGALIVWASDLGSGAASG